MGLKDMLEKAVKVSAGIKFFVQINDEEIREVSYIELGTYLVSNANDIEKVHIKMRD